MVSAEGLNRSAHAVLSAMIEHADELQVQPVTLDCGAQIVDCGVRAPGGIQAGVQLASVCLAGKAAVNVTSGDRAVWQGPWVQVATDHPTQACMMGQYAGWPVKHEDFFAMGSGPMRVRRGREELLESLKATDSQTMAVGSLECDALPDDELARKIADECRVAEHQLWLAVAPTRSMAGCVQVVARSIETSLHKLHELGGSLASVQSAYGIAPLPPPTPDFALGIGRTNDAILYGGQVCLWVDGDDAMWEEFGPQLPSSASKDYGAPFGEIFRRYDFDFYQIDPGLFSPAEVTIMNLRTGRSWRYGGLRPDLIAQSFATEAV